ncbi:SDR family oxidoreductase [Mucilaginibacter sp. RS28]|uniref:SDR family oxidoreductase n=1 Tax=Mucilaginibacter straminoryzae TaxID=2932774 RepID=A0A9X1X6C0_9SPHI|nr:SDR family oxidoreductase [Mucilaginibacter straminoryzae]MCJ8209464.1 SDR family oxidoreductase [Mucilaginibacter straminoryzae]
MKNALITGATKGIGRAIAIALAKEGLNLAICSRNIKDLTETQQHLQQLNPDIKVIAVEADVTKKPDLLKFAQTAVHELGEITVLVNNVGTFVPTSILDDEEETFDFQMNTNVRPMYELYRFFGKRLQNIGEGHVFNICSVAALNPSVNAGTYSVTKAATLCLSNIMRLEMQQYGVKVTSVIPGSTFTSSWEGTQLDKNLFVQPEDIAAAVLTIYQMSAGANVDEIIVKPLSGQL